MCPDLPQNGMVAPRAGTENLPLGGHKGNTASPSAAAAAAVGGITAAPTMEAPAPASLKKKAIAAQSVNGKCSAFRFCILVLWFYSHVLLFSLIKYILLSLHIHFDFIVIVSFLQSSSYDLFLLMIFYFPCSVLSVLMVSLTLNFLCTVVQLSCFFTILMYHLFSHLFPSIRKVTVSGGKVSYILLLLSGVVKMQYTYCTVLYCIVWVLFVKLEASVSSSCDKVHILSESYIVAPFSGIRSLQCADNIPP